MRKPKFKKNELVKIGELGQILLREDRDHLRNQYGFVLSCTGHGPTVSYELYLQNGTTYLFYEHELKKLTQ